MNVKDTVSITNQASDYHLRKAGKHKTRATLDNIQKDKTEGIETPKDSVEISKEAIDMAKEYPYIKEQIWKKIPLEDRMDIVHMRASWTWGRTENGDAILEIYDKEYRNKNKKTDQTKEVPENYDKAKENVYGQWKFNMDAFQGRINNTLINSINSKDTPVEDIKPAIVSEATAVPEESKVETEEAEAPEESDVEKFAQSLVDIAMNMDVDYGLDSDDKEYAFQRLPELSDEEYIELVRQGLEDGYRFIKDDLQKKFGNISEASAKFLEDVYKLAMKKFDALVEQVRQGQPLESRNVDLANQRLLNTGNISSGNA